MYVLAYETDVGILEVGFSTRKAVCKFISELLELFEDDEFAITVTEDINFDEKENCD